MNRYLTWLSVCLFSAIPIRATLAQSIIHVPGEATLQNAIAIVANGGIIEIAGGIYHAPGSAFGITDPDRHFTIRAAPDQTVTIAPSSGGTHGLFVISSPTESHTQHVTFERITFSTGVSNTDGVAGAVTMNHTDATFVDCDFQNNEASSTSPTGGNGGALVARDSHVLIVGSSFTGNTAWRSGGAIDVRGGSQLAIHDSQFLSNRVNVGQHYVSSLGGAVFVLDSSLRVTNTRFESNHAGFAGGAIYSYGNWSPTAPGFPTNLLIANSTFSGNSVKCNSSNCPTDFVGVAGALEAEDNVIAQLYNTRFEDNTAGQGGGIQLYRSTMAIHNSAFMGNQATGVASGMGYGGTINVVSADQNASDPVNRPSAQLSIVDSLFQGHHGTTTTTGRFGGCIFTQGDYNREYGLGGMQQNGTVQENRAVIDISRSIFSDCDAQGDAYPSGIGGALMTQLSKLTLSNTLFLGCDAIGSASGTGSGGALAIEDQSLADITNTTIAKSTAAFNGAAIWAAGAELNIADSQIIKNNLTTSQFDGTAIYTAPENIYQLNKATGLVQNTVFSNNNEPTGKHTVYEWDTGTISEPTNLMQYSSNRFYPDDASTYASRILGSGDVSFLNSIAAKAPFSNLGLAAEPKAGAIMAAPNAILPTNAPGDPPTPTTAYVGAAWIGGPATLDSNALSGNTVLQSASAENHILAIDGTHTWTTSIAQAPTPTSDLTLTPSVTSSGASVLSWQTPSGTFLDQIIDHGIAVPQPASASDSVAITQTASATYHGLMVSAEGGAYTTAHLSVVSDLIFYDGFDD